MLKTSNLTLKRKQFCTPREGNPGSVLLIIRICLKYFYQCTIFKNTVCWESYFRALVATFLWYGDLLCSLQTLERIMMTNNPLGAKNLLCFELCAKYTFGPLQRTLGEQNMAKSINNKKKSRRNWTKNRMLATLLSKPTH